MQASRHAMALAAALGLSLTATGQSTISADNPLITYTEFVSRTFTATPAPGRMSFSRLLPSTAIHADDSPSARANFATDATDVEITVELVIPGTMPGHDELVVFIDGVPNTLGPLTLGTTTIPILTAATSIRREFSVVWPIDADVDLVSLTLTNAANNELLAPPTRPCVRAAFFGDSVTHGQSSPLITNTWPHQAGQARNWQTINLGYSSHDTQAADGTFVAGTNPDIVVLAIGSNNFGSTQTASSLNDFATEYAGWIDNFCGGSDAPCPVPLICLTPIVRSDEVFQFVPPLPLFLLEEFRSEIRSIVRARNDANIYLLEGLDMISADPALFPDGLHPNGPGNTVIANSLSQLNLARNAGFEVEIVPPFMVTPPFYRGYQWTLAGSAVNGTAARTGLLGLELPPGTTAEQEILGLSEDQRFDLTAFVDGQSGSGVMELEFQDASGALLGLRTTAIGSSSWTQFSLSGFAPANSVRAVLRFRHTSGTGPLFVDDISLPLSLPPAVCEACSSFNDDSTIAVTGGTGQIGGSLQFDVGTTTGVQPTLALVSASLTSTTSCGTVIPGIGMMQGTPGESLIGDPRVTFIATATGPGPSWPVVTPIANDSQLIGAQLFFQGGLWFQNHVGVTNAMRVIILPP